MPIPPEMTMRPTAPRRSPLAAESSRFLTTLLAGVAPLLLAACQAPANSAVPEATGAAAPAATESAANNAATASPGGTLTDPGSGQCGGKDLHITRDDFSLVMDGDCGDVVITGSNGSLNISRARSIRVEGSGVIVLNEDTDVLLVKGDGNTLNMTRVGSAEVDGNDNGLLGTEYGKVVFRGTNNYVNTNNEPPADDHGTGNRVI